jgi:hypothetical protein
MISSSQPEDMRVELRGIEGNARELFVTDGHGARDGASQGVNERARNPGRLTHVPKGV